jgi:phage tail sheath protein FI
VVPQVDAAILAGIDTAGEFGPQQPIAHAHTAIAAFVGRTLKGPVNRPLTVRSFDEFQLLFGGLWQPAPLSYAVEQYFENGGGTAVIVRVVNGGRAPRLDLPAGYGRLTLTGLSPGSREYLRASVDYDGIEAAEPELFNLVVQRLRTAGSELVEDQEIFRRLSVLPESNRFVTDVLAESGLVRVVDSAPQTRPERTAPRDPRNLIGYVASNTDGDDGAPLSDYDVIGSAAAATGLFALRDCDEFNLLCVPPLSRDQDVGMSTLLVAARLCRERHALLLVDPPSGWSRVNDALAAMPRWPFQSQDAAMFYPRILAFDRLRGRFETFASSAAAAGMIARADALGPVWSIAAADEAVLRPGLRPIVAVADEDRARLAQLGVNVLQSVRAPGPALLAMRTLAASSSAASDWRFLPARRLALFLEASIERGTRWVKFVQNSPLTRARARAQVEAFLAGLEDAGAFAEVVPGPGRGACSFAICDERLNDPAHVEAGRFNLLFGFTTSRAGEYHTCLVTHTPAASSLRHVSVNRLVTVTSRVGVEIETSILRGLVDGARLRV